ncbi:hypothetical protein ACSQ67_013263 [Phaseolus vulgaris]
MSRIVRLLVPTVLASFMSREMFRVDDYNGRRNSGDDEGGESGDIEAHRIHRRNALARLRVNRETWETIELISFSPETTQTYRLAIKALPPAVSFAAATREPSNERGE